MDLNKASHQSQGQPPPDGAWSKSANISPRADLGVPLTPQTQTLARLGPNLIVGQFDGIDDFDFRCGCRRSVVDTPP